MTTKILTKVLSVMTIVILSILKPASAQTYSYTTALVADRTDVIGSVLVERNGNLMDVTFTVTDANWSITKTYLHIAPDVASIPKSPTGIPDIQNYAYKTDHSNVTYYKYENLDVTGMVNTYVSANANVTEANSCKVDVDYINSIVPTSKIYQRVQLTKNPAYFKMKLYDLNGNTIFQGDFFGNCIDLDHTIYDNYNYYPYAISSYSNDVTLLNCIVDKPENLDLANFIINQDYATMFGATGTEVQAAVWTLLDDATPQSGVTTAGVTWNQTIVNKIIADAKAKGEFYIPECDGYFIVLLDQGCKDAIANNTTPNITVQQSIFWLPINGIPASHNASAGACANAWAKGKKFNNTGWGQYFRAK